MRKLWWTILIVTIFGTVLVLWGPKANADQLGTATHDARWRHQTCRFQSLVPWRSWGPKEVRLTVRCAADQWNVSFSTMAYIINRESNWMPAVRNTSSGACGLAQWLPYVWANVHPYARLHGQGYGRSCTNPRSNSLAMAHYAARHGWSPWS